MSCACPYVSKSRALYAVRSILSSTLPPYLLDASERISERVDPWSCREAIPSKFCAESTTQSWVSVISDLGQFVIGKALGFP